MKLPEKPPSFTALRQESLLKLFQKATEREVQEFIKAINVKYKPWDEVKHLQAPAGLSSEEAWAVLKLSRHSSRKFLPLVGTSGTPFSYWLPDNLHEALHEVDQGSGGDQFLTGVDAALPAGAKDQIVINSLMEEAIATSQIEGAVTTRDQAKEMLRSKRRPKNKSEQMVLNSYRTINMLRSVTKEPLSIDLINRIQSEITVDTLDDPAKAGTFRTKHDNIVVADNTDGSVVFTPPAADLLPDRMQKLVDFANKPSTDANFIHPLVKASILHFWLAYEHPYVDGNGRTARALFYWFMLKHGYWLFEYLTISRIVLEAPGQYYRSFLYSEHDDNDLTYSIYFMLKATRNSIKRLKRYLSEKQAQSRRLASLLRAFPGINYRQRELLSSALKAGRHELYTIASHQSSHGVSYQTARTDLLDLVARGLLSQSTSGKQLMFFPVADLADQIEAKSR